MNLALIVSLINNTASGANGIIRGLEGVRKKAAEVKSGFASGIAPAFSGEAFDRNLGKFDQRIGRAKSKLAGAAAMAAGLFAPVFTAAKFETQFAEFASVAEIPLEKQAEIERRLIKQTALTGKNKSELLDIVAAYVGKGMGIDQALSAVETTGKTASASYSNASDMANAGFAIIDNLKVLPEQLQKAFEIMVSTGKEGSFELKDMARKFPELTGSLSALKMQGPAAVASLAAILQIAMKTAGSTDQAANNTANFLSALAKPDTLKKFKKFGIDVEKELNSATKKGTDPLFHMLSIIKNATNGNQFKMGELFADKQVLDFLRAAIPNLEEYTRIRDKAANSEGLIDKDFAKSQKSLIPIWRGLVREIDNLFSTSSGLMPVIKDILTSITSMIVATRLWTEANPELTSGIVKGTAALLAFGIASRVLGFAYALLSKQLFSLIGLFFRFNDAGKNIAVLSRVFGSLGSVLKSLRLAAVGASMLSVAGGASMLTSAIAALAAPFVAFKAVALGIGAVLTGLSLPITALIAVVAGLALAIFNYWQPISNFVAGFAGAIGDELSGLVSSIADFGSQIASEISGWMLDRVIDASSILGISPETVKAVLAAVTTTISSFVSSTISLVGSIGSSVGNWFMDLFSINQYSAAAETEFRSAGKKFGELFIAGIKTIPQKILAIFTGLGAKIVASIGNINWSSFVPDWAMNLTGGATKPASLPSVSPPVYQKPNTATPQSTTSNAPFSASSEPNDSALMGDLKNFLQTTPIKQEVDAKINAAVIDKRPPNITVHAPITVHEAANGRGTAAKIRRELRAAVSSAKGGALHDGVDE